jgi:HD-GYP domain-containing protein (c-di-GMP phosphodiesterase class II)
MPSHLKILVIGGDASLSVAIGSVFAGRATNLSVAGAMDPDVLEAAAREVDVIVAVPNGSNGHDPTKMLRMIRLCGLQRDTVVIAEAGDRRIAAEALALGMGGYVVHGTSAKQLGMAIRQVVEKGVMYDAPAAEVLHSTLEASGGATAQPDMSAMSAARALASALELKDTYTGGHAERVASLAMRLSRRAGLPGALPEEPLEAAFLLHDVGKIGIPERILNKPGGLNEAERRVLQTHPILGERIVAPLGFPPVVRSVIRHHHERWDGRGYPDRLAAEAIPPAARLFAIADAVDAMTSVRPYRPAMTFEEAIGEILNNAGSQFDPFLCELVEETYLGGPLKLHNVNQ